MGRMHLVRNREPVPTDEFFSRLLSIDRDLERFALSLANNPHDAADVLQETYLKALPHKERYHSGEIGDLKTWAFGIMSNAFKDHFLKYAKYRAWAEELPVEELQSLTDSYAMGDGIGDLIEKLDDKYRIPFMMQFSGYRHKEIANVLGLREETAKGRVFRARRKLMKALGHTPTGASNNRSNDGSMAKKIREGADLKLVDLSREMGYGTYSVASLVSAYEKGVRTPANPPRGEVSKKYVSWLKDHGYNPFNL
jgi:RNA polymerase sigma-70 factor (ECF subfamily)